MFCSCNLLHAYPRLFRNVILHYVSSSGVHTVLHLSIFIYLLPYIHLQEHPKDVETVTIKYTIYLLNYRRHNRIQLYIKFTQYSINTSCPALFYCCKFKCPSLPLQAANPCDTIFLCLQFGHSEIVKTVYSDFIPAHTGRYQHAAQISQIY